MLDLRAEVRRLHAHANELIRPWALERSAVLAKRRRRTRPLRPVLSRRVGPISSAILITAARTIIASHRQKVDALPFFAG
jgi:hypothetical protein